MSPLLLPHFLQLLLSLPLLLLLLSLLPLLLRSLLLLFLLLLLLPLLLYLPLFLVFPLLFLLLLLSMPLLWPSLFLMILRIWTLMVCFRHLSCWSDLSACVSFLFLRILRSLIFLFLVQLRCSSLLKFLLPFPPLSLLLLLQQPLLLFD